MDLSVVFTLRSSRLRKHKGEMAFPGGRCDTGESGTTAAQPETLEEVGVPSFAYDLISAAYFRSFWRDNLAPGQSEKENDQNDIEAVLSSLLNRIQRDLEGLECTQKNMSLEEGGSLSPMYSTPSKSFVYPKVALHPAKASAVDDILPLSIASPDEVESIHFLRLSHYLLDPQRFHHRMKRPWDTTNSTVEMPCFYTHPGSGSTDTVGKCVWGITAFIFCELLVRIHKSINQV